MHFCCILGPGSGLGPVWAPCEGGGASRQPKAAQNGGSEAPLAALWGDFGCHLGHMRVPLGSLGVILGAIGLTWEPLGVPSGSLGVTLADFFFVK